MKRAIARTKHLIAPPIYVAPIKRWKRLSPYLAGIFWLIVAAVCACAYASSRGAL